MAVDKLVDSGALDTGLTSIADKIRSRSGGSNQLAFPTGFVSEIDNIPQGGGGAVEEKDVNFYDYDGTLVDSYTAAEFLALSSMPANPTHTGLTAQGWNWSLADAKAFVQDNGALDVGQNYITDDEKTRIYVTLNEETLSPVLHFSLSGTATVDWGDGTTESVTGSSNYTNIARPHTYNSAGDYIITIYDITVKAFLGDAWVSGSVYGCLMSSNQNAVYYHIPYMATITRIELGKNMACGHYMAYRAYNLEAITIPTTGMSLCAQNMVENCYNLKCIIIPNGVNTVSQHSLWNSGLEKIIFPKTITTFNSGVMTNCTRLEKIVLPDGIDMNQQTFVNCSYLRKVIIPSNVRQPGGQNFQQCSNLKEIHLPSAWTNIPANMFMNCNRLSNITIHEGITNINASAFSADYSLTKITIPSTVTNIGAGAFSGSWNIKEYHLKPTTPPTLTSTNSLDVQADCIIYVPAGSLEAYQTATNWSTYASKMQEE